MKRILLSIFLFTSLLGSSYAQEFRSLSVKGGFQSEFERLGVGAQGNFYFTDNFRLSPEMTFYFPNNNTTGFDLTGNISYLLRIEDNFALYPIVGLSILNNRAAFGGTSVGNTDVGFNFGVGGELDLSDKFYLNVDAKYVLTNMNHVVTMAGIGFRFN